MSVRPTAPTRVLEKDVERFKAGMRSEMEALRKLVRALSEEVRQLRVENDLLALAVAGREQA